jgi:cyclopropane fatty-acyl-phospholipid synthase-like methyltransferase
MARILSSKKLFSGYNTLLQIKYKNNIISRFYNLLKFPFKVSFSLIIPIIKKSHIYSYVKKKLDFTFFNSSKYWESRYFNGGTSGVGSYGKLASYKAEVINSFVKKNNIKNAIDFGCGDGNQTTLYNIPKYIGLDISKTAIELCKQKFRDDPSKQFLLYQSQFFNKNNMIENADLTLSIDVLFHLVEYDIFLKYIDDLFSHSNQYVIIYSTNFNKTYSSFHQIDREFTSIIEEKIRNFKLFKVITNPCKGKETMSDFFIYKKIR